LNRVAWIGNDIVDLAEPGAAGKERDHRFMARVFTPAERARILEAMAPTLALWKAWTAKETAFKIVSKIRGRAAFVHRAFEVATPAADEAVVRFEDLVVRVRWETALDYIHCIGQLAARPEERRPLASVLTGIAHDGQPLNGMLTPAERSSVYSTASARARLLARRLMERWNLQEAEVLRLWRAWGWSAPVLVQNGDRLPGLDVSLSHDGRFVAAALARLA
jgi:phosphopantetheine--protein transferase-like protein